MSQSHFNYMSGVPVKIAENYKPPKKLALTQSVSQRLSTSSSITTQLLDKTTYNFGLEQTVIAKMNEWQRMRQRENCDRKDRLSSYQQERQSLFDAKQKQMLTAVSYPSTDDLSSDDDGDDSGHGTSSDASKSAVSLKTVSIPTTAVPSQPKGPQQQFSPPNYFNNILVPTVMPGQEKSQLKQNVTPAKSSHYSKFNFHEFENDTSSPFDNVELKTINDLDILAEVWNTSAAINNTNTSSKDNTPTGEDATASSRDTGVKTNEHTQLPNHVYPNQSVNSSAFQQAVNSAQHEQTNCAPVNHSAVTATISAIPTTNSFYGNQVHYNHHIDPNHSYPMANQTFNNTAINNNPSYTTQMHAQHSAIGPNNYVSHTYTERIAAMAMPNHNNANTTSMYGDKTVIPTTNSIQTKSKSKSVPDIMQEINTEIQNSQGRRVRNSSQSKNFSTIFSRKLFEY